MSKKSQDKKYELKIKSWNDVTLGQYEKITEILTDDEASTTEKDIALMSILYGVPEDEIWGMEINTVQGLRLQAQWLNQAPSKPEPIRFKSIKIGNFDCTIDTNIQHMSMAQYVDFQTYFDKEVTKKAEILSCFLIPKGHKYGEGYDIVELIQAIKDNIPMSTYNSVWFFFLKEYQNSTLRLATALEMELKMKRMMMKKSNPLKEKYKELEKKIRDSKMLPIFG